MFRKKLVLMLLAVLVAFGMLSVSGSYQGVKADMSGHDHPTVTVTPGGSITVVGTGMDYSSRAAGTYIPYTEGGGHKVAVTVSTNCTTWAVACGSSPVVLTSGAETIPSGNFKYTSVYGGTGTPINPLVYGPLEFGTSTSVMANPSAVAANACLVDVRYDLTIGPTQAAAASYTAIHTYTLTAS